MKVLIIGGESFLGKKLKEVLSQDYIVLSSCHKAKSSKEISIDLTNGSDMLRKLEKARPDVIIVVAALNSIEGCEQDKELAWKTNVESLKPMIIYCCEENKKLIFLSSCAVFDGNHPPYKKDDLKAPISFYGVTKLIGENMIRRDLENYIIIRSDAFYGYNDDKDRPTFPIEVMKTLKQRKVLEVDNTRHIYPTLIDDLALKIKFLIEKDRTGIFQITGDEQTHFSFAQEIVRVFYLSKGLIKEKTKKYFLRPQDGEMKLDLHTSSIQEGLVLMKKKMEDAESKYL